MSKEQSFFWFFILTICPKIFNFNFCVRKKWFGGIFLSKDFFWGISSHKMDQGKETYFPTCLFLRTQGKFSKDSSLPCIRRSALLQYLLYPCSKEIVLSLKTFAATYQVLVLWNHRIADALCPDSELRALNLNQLPSKEEVVKPVIIYPSIYKQRKILVFSVYIQKDVANIHYVLVKCHNQRQLVRRRLNGCFVSLSYYHWNKVVYNISTDTEKSKHFFTV